MLIRPRRNRKSKAIRSLVKETQVTANDLIFPLFLEDGNNIKREIKSLQGTYRYSIDTALKEIEECIELGLQSFILFPAVQENLKDKIASYSYSDKNFYLQYIRKIKETFPEVNLISDVAMDPYSSDGHDGFVENGKILNDETLDILGKMSIAQANAGIDMIGPSDMMDGRVQFIREALDNEGFTETSIMSYSAKYASALYGPFRDALESAPKAGDKKTYQMDPSNRLEAIKEALLDEQEGADFLMVKPAMLYLDIIREVKNETTLPVSAYQVSGECAMISASANNGWINLEQGISESLTCIKRAGADAIITYFAKQYLQNLRK